jgi:hypothetical protein
MLTGSGTPIKGGVCQNSGNERSLLPRVWTFRIQKDRLFQYHSNLRFIQCSLDQWTRFLLRKVHGPFLLEHWIFVTRNWRRTRWVVKKQSVCKDIGTGNLQNSALSLAVGTPLLPGPLTFRLRLSHECCPVSSFLSHLRQKRFGLPSVCRRNQPISLGCCVPKTCLPSRSLLPVTFCAIRTE